MKNSLYKIRASDPWYSILCIIFLIISTHTYLLFTYERYYGTATRPIQLSSVTQINLIITIINIAITFITTIFVTVVAKLISKLLRKREEGAISAGHLRLIGTLYEGYLPSVSNILDSRNLKTITIIIYIVISLIGSIVTISPFSIIFIDTGYEYRRVTVKDNEYSDKLASDLYFNTTGFEFSKNYDRYNDTVVEEDNTFDWAINGTFTRGWKITSVLNPKTLLPFVRNNRSEVVRAGYIPKISMSCGIAVVDKGITVRDNYFGSSNDTDNTGYILFNGYSYNSTHSLQGNITTWDKDVLSIDNGNLTVAHGRDFYASLIKTKMSFPVTGLHKSYLTTSNYTSYPTTGSLSMIIPFEQLSSYIPMDVNGIFNISVKQDVNGIPLYYPYKSGRGLLCSYNVSVIDEITKKDLFEDTIFLSNYSDYSKWLDTTGPLYNNIFSGLRKDGSTFNLFYEPNGFYIYSWLLSIRSTILWAEDSISVNGNIDDTCIITGIATEETEKYCTTEYFFKNIMNRWMNHIENGYMNLFQYSNKAELGYMNVAYPTGNQVAIWRFEFWISLWIFNVILMIAVLFDIYNTIVVSYNNRFISLKDLTISQYTRNGLITNIVNFDKIPHQLTNSKVDTLGDISETRLLNQTYTIDGDKGHARIVSEAKAIKEYQDPRIIDITDYRNINFE